MSEAAAPPTKRVAILYSESSEGEYSLRMRLKHDDLKLIRTRSLDSLILLCQRHDPTVVLIRSVALARDIATIFKRLTSLGMDFSRHPTVLLVRSRVVRSVTPLLEIGLEDIIDIEKEGDLLVERIKEISDRAAAQRQNRLNQPTVEEGTRGKLSDMSIIDLIQALGPSQRTVRITVTAGDGDSESLVIYLNRGVITHATLGEKKSEEAMYHALTWSEGTWLLEPIDSGKIPETNVTLPNEHILMEGCRLIDEGTQV